MNSEHDPKRADAGARASESVGDGENELARAAHDPRARAHFVRRLRARRAASAASKPSLTAGPSAPVDAPGASGSASWPVGDPPDQLYDLTLHSESKITRLTQANRSEVVRALREHERNILSWVAAGEEGSREIALMHSDVAGGVAGYISDHLADATAPDAAIWSQSRDLLHQADAALRSGEVEDAAKLVNDAASAYRMSRKKLDDYRAKTEGGAGKAVQGLQVAEMAGAVAISVLSGGGAAGLVAGAARAGVAAGLYGAGLSVTEQASGLAQELGDRVDIRKVVSRGIVEAVSTFSSALIGGALAKMFLGKLVPIVVRQLADTSFAAAASHALVQRVVCGALAGAASAPFNASIRLVLEHFAQARELPTAGEFFDSLLTQMLRDGAMMALFGAVEHAVQSGSASRKAEPTSLDGAARRVPERGAPSDHDLATPGGERAAARASDQRSASQDAHLRDTPEAAITRLRADKGELQAAVKELLNRPIPPDARAALEGKWGQLEELASSLRNAERVADPAALRQAERELAEARQAASSTVTGGEGAGAEAESSANRAKENWERADARVKEWASSKEPLSLDRIKELNAILGEGLINNGGTAGKIRTTENVGTQARTPGNPRARVFNPYLPGRDVPAAMDEFVTWYREAERTMAAPELAARSYQRLVSIHPFTDANGRTCRMVMDWILRRNGLPPAVLSGNDINVAVFGDDLRMGRGSVPAELALEAVTRGVERALQHMIRALTPGAGS